MGSEEGLWGLFIYLFLFKNQTLCHRGLLELSGARRIIALQNFTDS